MLAKSKLSSIEKLISQTLIDMDISHKYLLQFWMKKISMRRWKTNYEVKMKNIKLWDWAVWNRRFK